MKTPEKSVIDRMFDPLGEILSQDVAQKLVNLRFEAKIQRHIEKLARKCNQGTMTDAERRDYRDYVQTMEFISILQMKAQALLKRSRESN